MEAREPRAGEASVSIVTADVVGAFYMPSELTEATFERDGIDWNTAYRARYDGIGYLVFEAKFTAILPIELVEEIVLSMRELIERKVPEVADLEGFVAQAGTPGVVDGFNRLKRRLRCCRIIERIFTPMRQALLPRAA